MVSALVQLSENFKCEMQNVAKVVHQMEALESVPNTYNVSWITEWVLRVAATTEDCGLEARLPSPP